MDLRPLHQEIDTHVAAMRASHPDWRCGKGCDGCCRRLADVPQLTGAEWALLRQALVALPGSTLAAVAGRVAGMRPGPGGLTCPLLDEATGLCLVYAHRPVACRSYGYYVQRDKGLYCEEIRQQVEGGELADVVWGNHDAIERRLEAMGPARPLTTWFAELPMAHDAGPADAGPADGG